MTSRVPRVGVWLSVCGALFLAVVVSQGCAPSPPLVLTPEEGWEEEAERGMLRDFGTPTPTPKVDVWEAPDKRLPDEDGQRGGFVTALADIIGFPFRAVAWLAHVLL
jgi:hypothetical protein